MSELFNVLQVNLGSLYVNDFNRFGRTWQVNVQASSDFRRRLKIAATTHPQRQRKNGSAGNIGQHRRQKRAGAADAYNMYPAAAINLSPAAGVSSDRRSNGPQT